MMCAFFDEWMDDPPDDDSDSTGAGPTDSGTAALSPSLRRAANDTGSCSARAISIEQAVRARAAR